MALAGVRLFLMNSGVNHASRCLDDITDTRFRVKHFQSLVHSRFYRIEPTSAFSQNCLKKNMSMNYLHSWNPSTYPVSVSRVSRKYTSFFGSKGEHHDLQESEISFPSVSNQSNVHSTDVGGGNDDWSANLKKASRSTEDATREKSEAASSELTSHVQQLLHTFLALTAIIRDPDLASAIIRVGGTLTPIIRNPDLINAIIGIGGTLTGTLLVWLVMSKVFTELHKISFPEQNPHNSVSLEDPVRYLLTFMAFSLIGMMIAPTTIKFQYIKEAWYGAALFSTVWFYITLSTHTVAKLLDYQKIIGFRRERLLARNTLLSVCSFTYGLWCLPGVCNVRLCILGLTDLAKTYGFDGLAVLLTLGVIGDDMVPPLPVKQFLNNVAKALPKLKLVPQKGLGQMAFRDLEKRKLTLYIIIAYKDKPRLRTAVQLLKISQEIERRLEEEVSLPLFILHGESDAVTDPSFLHE